MSAGRSRSCSSAAADSLPPASSPTTCGPSPDRVAGRAMCSTGTAGATTRWSAPPTASTAPGRVRGRCMSRTASSPGRPRRPITRRWARTVPSTSRAGARAAPRFPGTRTRRPGCGIPYARGVLVEMYREAKARLGDPVLAWADIQADPERRRRYQRARGKGGLVRVSWAEATELIAAAHVHTIKTYGPDRVAGFSPIPAMSMVSFAAGSRFVELIGGVMTSFYDWYADLPVASPQVFGDQTDVPESGDWWDAAYLVMWGSNVPVTRTPDAHWMAEVRYRGTKVCQRQPGLRRQHEIRRRVDAVCGGDRRGAGDGDGSRHLVGMLRAQPGSVLRRLRAAVHRSAVPGQAGGTRRRAGARQEPDGGRSRSGRGERRVQTGAAGRGDRHRRGAEGLAGIPLRRRRCGQVEPGSRRPGTGFDRRGARRADRAGSSAALRHGRRARRDLVAGGAGATGRRTPGVHGVRPDAGPVRGGPARAAGRLAHRLRRRRRAVHPGLAGADHRGVRRAGRSASPRSWPATPWSPVAAR